MYVPSSHVSERKCISINLHHKTCNFANFKFLKKTTAKFPIIFFYQNIILSTHKVFFNFLRNGSKANLFSVEDSIFIFDMFLVLFCIGQPVYFRVTSVSNISSQLRAFKLLELNFNDDDRQCFIWRDLLVFDPRHASILVSN